MIDVFFKLIRSGLYGTKLNNSEIPIQIDWKQIIDLSQKHTSLGLVADAVMRLPSEVKVPSEIKYKLMESAFTIAKSHSILDQKVAEVIRFFESKEIPTILLKGQGIARCYRNPLMRQCGDIDLYIGNKNYNRACALAQEILETNPNKSIETEKHYHFNSGKVTVELHRIAASPTPIHSKEFLKWVESILEIGKTRRFIEINNTQVHLPEPLFDVFFIFYHAWRHLLFYGIGLRQICDWTMILNRYYDQINLESLQKVLLKFQLMRPWQIFGNIAVDYLGLPIAKMPFYNPSYSKKSKRVLDVILECGNFGYHSKDFIFTSIQLPFFRRKWRSFYKITKWYMHLFPLFPKEASLKFVIEVPKNCLFAFRQLFHHKNS